MRRSIKKGFTLIELLVVIAIIAILAAIIFPVYARAKISAYRSSDISNLNSLRNALQLYRADQGAYPPALLGYATLYTAGGNNVVPADQLKSFLYSRRVDSVDTFRPALNRPKNVDITTAFWPSQDPRSPGSAPVVDTNGDGKIDSLDDTGNARQAYGPLDGPVNLPQFPGSIKGPNGSNPNQVIDATGNLYFYNVSGYDVAKVNDGTGATRTELRYTLFWTKYALIGSGGSYGSIGDDPRQLGYSEPPDNTVITWDSYFRDYSNNALQREKTDLVLFLGGAARPFDSVDLSQRSWRVTP